MTRFVQGIGQWSRGGRDRFRCVVVLSGVAALVAAAQAPLNMRARSVWYPTYDSGGKMTAQVLGESAVVQADGCIKVTGFKMELLDDGVIDVRITADECLYRPKEGSASSESNVVVERKNLVISGRGFTWSAEDHVVQIRENTRVVLRNIGELANEHGAR